MLTLIRTSSVRRRPPAATSSPSLPPRTGEGVSDWLLMQFHTEGALGGSNRAAQGLSLRRPALKLVRRGEA